MLFYAQLELLLKQKTWNENQLESKQSAKQKYQFDDKYSSSPPDKHQSPFLTHVKLAFLNQLQPTVRLLLNFTTPNQQMCVHMCVCVCACWFSIEAEAEFSFFLRSKVVCQLCGFWGWHVGCWCDPKQVEQLMPDYDDGAALVQGKGKGKVQKDNGGGGRCKGFGLTNRAKVLPTFESLKTHLYGKKKRICISCQAITWWWATNKPLTSSRHQFKRRSN